MHKGKNRRKGWNISPGISKHNIPPVQEEGEAMEKNRSYPGYLGSTHAYNYNCNYSRVIGLELEDISGGGGGRSYSFNGPSASKASDPESKRKKRIASYIVHAAEGRLKFTFTNSFKWIKSKFSDFPYSPRDDL